MAALRMTLRGSLVALVLLSAGSIAHATSARDVLSEGKRLDDTSRKWTDRTQTMTLRIVSPGGGELTRRLTVVSRRYPEDEDKSLAAFEAPSDVKGIGFLEWAHKGRENEQWLYLPEFRRSRRLAARGRDEAFVNSDFTYRDFEVIGKLFSWSESEAPSQLLRVEAVDGHDCHVVELRPSQDGMPYTRLLVWIDVAKIVPRRIQFFTTDEATPSKQLELADIRDVGAIPTPHHLEMKQLPGGSRTIVDLEKVEYDTGVEDDRFTLRFLERGEF